MIKVCDAIMGSGKSSAAITLMNENPDRKFIYITPYIEEAKRICRSCPDMHIVEPRKKSEYHGSKTLHTIDLVREDRNVATTHQAFKYYPDELLDLIREKEYTLIVDESVNVFDRIEINDGDMEMLLASGFVSMDDGGVITLANPNYHGTQFRKLFSVLRTRDIVKIGSNYFCWQLPPTLFLAAPVVYILTYMFEGQELSYLFDMSGIEYEKIGVSVDEAGTYRFSGYPGTTPAYVADLPDKIHIFDNDKLNQIGDSDFDLSLSWYKNNKGDVSQMKNNLYNFFNHYMGDVDAADRMWGSYEVARHKIKGKGYTKGFVMWNERAKNDYRNRKVLAYCSNVFMNVDCKRYFVNHGVDVDENMYALSILIQWIWRSSIRDGQSIDLYIPSSRMRGLLAKWIYDTCKGVTD